MVDFQRKVKYIAYGIRKARNADTSLQAIASELQVVDFRPLESAKLLFEFAPRVR